MTVSATHTHTNTQTHQHQHLQNKHQLHQNNVACAFLFSRLRTCIDTCAHSHAQIHTHTPKQTHSDVLYIETSRHSMYKQNPTHKTPTLLHAHANFWSEIKLCTRLHEQIITKRYTHTPHKQNTYVYAPYIVHTYIYIYINSVHACVYHK